MLLLCSASCRQPGTARCAAGEEGCGQLGVGCSALLCSISVLRGLQARWARRCPAVVPPSDPLGFAQRALLQSSFARFSVQNTRVRCCLFRPCTRELRPVLLLLAACRAPGSGVAAAVQCCWRSSGQPTLRPPCTHGCRSQPSLTWSRCRPTPHSSPLPLLSPLPLFIPMVPRRIRAQTEASQRDRAELRVAELCSGAPHRSVAAPVRAAAHGCAPLGSALWQCCVAVGWAPSRCADITRLSPSSSSPRSTRAPGASPASSKR